MVKGLRYVAHHEDRLECLDLVVLGLLYVHAGWALAVSALGGVRVLNPAGKKTKQNGPMTQQAWETHTHRLGKNKTKTKTKQKGARFM